MAARWRAVTDPIHVVASLPHLPSADFSIDDIDEADGSEAEELFSHSRYVGSLGVEERASANKENNSDSPLPALSSGAQDGEAVSGNSTKDGGAYDEDEDDWEAFKEEFSSSEVPEDDGVDSAYIREQLLINTLTYLHGAGSQFGSARDVEAVTSGRKGVLTLGGLEMIEESELDKALESFHLEDTRDAGSTHRDNQVPLAWDNVTTTGIADSVLMSKLEELSYADGASSGPCYVDVSVDALTEPRWRYVGRPMESKQQTTVFLDLRSEQGASSAHTISVSSSAQRLLALKGMRKQASSSGSDTEENEMLWKQQRTKLKTDNESLTMGTSGRVYVSTVSQRSAINVLEEVVEPSGSDSNFSASGSDLFQTPIVPPGDHSTEDEAPQSPTDLCGGRGVHTESSTRGVPTSKCQSKREQRPKKKSKQKGKGEQKREDNRKNVQSSVKNKHAASSDGEISSVCDGISSVGGGGVSDGISSVGGDGVSDGTSSVSDGTGASSVSDGTSRVCNEMSLVCDTKSSVHDDKKSNASSEPNTGGAKNGSSKKKKASKNSGSSKGSSKGHKKSEHKHRRIPPPSSDEDVALTTGEEKVDIPAKVPRSVEDTKDYLRDYIMSKKPPATFETPATQPTFHEGASFGAVKVAVDPTHTTDCLLVLKLSEAGTLEQQPEGPLLSAEAQTGFQCLLLSWLATLAIVGEEGKEEGPLVSALPVRVTGLLQTVINGSRCLVVGVASSAARSHPNRDVDTAGAQALQDVLDRVTVKEALTPVLVFASKYLQLAILEELEPILVQPLSGLFTLQEDTSPLRTHVSFYWHSLYTATSHQSAEAFSSQTPLETTVCVVPLSPPFLGELVLVVVQEVYRVGLDLAGVRLLYDQSATSLLEGNGTETGGGRGGSDDTAPILALALRGPDALHTWMDVIGPKDVALARITDPESISARFGGTGSRTPLPECVRTPYAVPLATALCFGGRGCTRTGSVLGVSDPGTKSERRRRQRVRFSDSSETDEISRSSTSSDSPTPPPLLAPLVSNLPALVVPPFGKFVLALSPQVTPSLYPAVLATCSRFGYDLLGVRRMRLNQKRATALGFPTRSLSGFTPTSSSPSTSPTCTPRSAHPLPGTARPPIPLEVDAGSPPLPSTFLLLGRENAFLHSAALVVAVLRDLAAVQEVWSDPPSPACLSSASSVAHTLECSDGVLGMLGGFSPLPLMTYTQVPLPSQGWEWPGCTEEVCVVAVTQSSGLRHALEFLGAVFNVRPVNASSSSPSELPFSGALLGDTVELGGLELLGMKLVPQLSRYHAKQLCPFEPSSPFYQVALNALSDVPVLLVVLRGLQCNARVQRLIPQLVRSGSEPKVGLIASTNFQHAFDLLSVFFTDKELFCDFKGRVLSPYTPTPSIDCILSTLQDPVQPLCSVLFVPSGQGGLFVKVLQKLFRAGFRFVGMTCCYGDQENGTVKSGSGVLVVCVEHLNAVWGLKKQLEPFVRSSETTRPTLSYSNTYKEAVADIARYFPKGIYCQSAIYHQLNCAVEGESVDFPIVAHLPPPPSSPFMETTVVVHCTSNGSFEGELVRCLDLLLQADFCLLGISMTWFSAAKARDVLSACPSQVMLDDLASGPCTVLLIRRDNAASCFSDVLRRLSSKSDLRLEGKELDNLERAMVIPKNIREAKAVMKVLGCAEV